MSDKLWATVVAAAMGVSACGGDDKSGGGSGGSAGTAGGTAGAGGGGNAAGSGGSAGGPEDTTPPDFGGLTTATATAENQVELSWDAATDDISAESRIAYRIYQATTAGGHDFTSPKLTTPSGATSAFLSDLDAATNYFFVARAVDEAGNEDDNTAEMSAGTSDSTPPKFPGIQGLSAMTSRSLLVEWRPGLDNADGENLSYNVYVATSESGQDFASPSATASSGETTALVDVGIAPETQYFVVVRAVDGAGNEDTNTKELNTITPEGQPPTFAGLKEAVAIGNDIRLYWPPASDGTGTEVANIVYDIYHSTSSAGQSFSDPPLDTSEPGAIKHSVSGLPAGVKHYFVVRARDSAGNSDANTVEQNETLVGTADTTAPTFGGVENVTGTSPSTLVIDWSPASDTIDSRSEITYDIYVSPTAGGQDFSSPTFSTLPGANCPSASDTCTATITGLNPGTARFVVIRARDSSGNSLAATSPEASGTTLANPMPTDTAAPTFTPGLTVTTDDPRPERLMASWTDATDANWTAADIRYHVCVERTQANCIGANFNNHVRETTDYGVTSITLDNLKPRTVYFVHVRAEDRSGNIDTANNFGSAVTATSFIANVQPILLDECSSCHDFHEGFTRIVNVGSGFEIVPGSNNFLKLVDPGVPEDSYLYRKINPLGYTGAPFSPANPNLFTESQEPRTGDGLPTFNVLSGAEDGAIRDWIAQGAFGN